MSSFLNCMTKIRYRTLQGAQKHQKRNARKGWETYPYLCRECLQYHLTKQKPLKPILKEVRANPITSYRGYPVVKEDVQYIYVALSKGNLYKLLNLGFELFDKSKTARLSKKKISESTG